MNRIEQLARSTWDEAQMAQKSPAGPPWEQSYSAEMAQKIAEEIYGPTPEAQHYGQVAALAAALPTEEEPVSEWIIAGPFDDEGVVTYWSNETGWGSPEGATRFNKTERETFNLPAGAVGWITVGPFWDKVLKYVEGPIPWAEEGGVGGDERLDAIDTARAHYCAESSDDIEVDEDAIVLKSGETGYWVRGWLFVRKEDEDE